METLSLKRCATRSSGADSTHTSTIPALALTHASGAGLPGQRIHKTITRNGFMKDSCMVPILGNLPDDVPDVLGSVAAGLGPAIISSLFSSGSFAALHVHCATFLC